MIHCHRLLLGRLWRSGARRSQRIHLPWLHWLHTELTGRAFQARRRSGFFTLQQEAALLFNQVFAFAPQRFSLVTVSQGRKVKSTRVQETTGKHQTADQQQSQTRLSGTISRLRHECISLF